MAIDRAFTMAGHGTVVTGTVASGRVTVGDELEWHPAGSAVRVRGLHQHDRPVDWIGRGSRAAINLVGVHHTEIHRGQELAAPGYLQASQIIAVEVFGSEGAVRPLRHRGRYKLHLGTAEVSAVLSLLETNQAAAGQPQLGQLFVAEPIAAVFGQPFILRDESPPTTLGGGRIVQPNSRRYRRRDETSIERLHQLGSVNPVERLRAALTFLGFTPWTQRRICALTGMPVDQVQSCLTSLESSGALVELHVGPKRSIRVLAEHAADLEDRILRAMGRLHAARPRLAAIPRVHLSAALPDLANDALGASLVDRLVAQRRLIADLRTIALPGYEPKLSQAERKLKNELIQAIRAGGMSPPELPDLTALAGARSSAVPDLLALLRDENRIVEISSNLFLDVDAESEVRRRVTARLVDGSSITMSELRDLLGTTRRYSVPLGEYLDRIGLTKREGDSRRLNPSAIPPSPPTI
jgi:selenocysteine-specific elongation factor